MVDCSVRWGFKFADVKNRRRIVDGWRLVGMFVVMAALWLVWRRTQTDVKLGDGTAFLGLSSLFKGCRFSL